MSQMLATQDPSTSSRLQALQGQEATLVKQLASAEANLKSYEKQLASMSSNERELNILVRQNREQQVVSLRGELDATRQRIADVRSWVATSSDLVVVPAPDRTVPAMVGSTEPPFTLFGLTPNELRGPAEFILLFPLIVALSRWIWRRSPTRSSSNSQPENAQINRLEMAVEAIAIEVERIGEAQRFSARLMAEQPKEPVIELRREPVKPSRRVVTPLP